MGQVEEDAEAKQRIISFSFFRHVLEDMLLKDNEENRNLQKELLKAAEDLTSKASKKKKGERRLSDRVRQSVDSSEDWAEGSVVEDPEDGEIQFNILRGEREVEEDNTSLRVNQY